MADQDMSAIVAMEKSQEKEKQAVCIIKISSYAL
jgi:hypothetical protein